ncbi:MAG: hypothetical protein BSOLF_2888 [Candidatus Carbobacillus altaicus]|uniref:Uncharacterized protein n=1 Tax=Candidatus Carbonibacillus altaicus TaxID=2163959 RepID=A0A2R6Y1S1_9BACL|nr:MAG: hypothetical protein BSOLF_2888 [Candidatus Carbobacillus altaicus]
MPGNPRMLGIAQDLEVGWVAGLGAFMKRSRAATTYNIVV